MGAGGTKVPTHPSAAGGWDFLVACCSSSLEWIRLLVWCASVSDKDQILELDSKAEIFFSFFFPKSKIGCVGMGRRSKLFGSIRNSIVII